MSTTEEIVYSCITKMTPGCPQLRPEAHLKDDLSMSSLSLISVVTELCSQLQVDVTDLAESEIATLATAGDLVRLFERNVSA
jgi:acyl carrier protein